MLAPLAVRKRKPPAPTHVAKKATPKPRAKPIVAPAKSALRAPAGESLQTKLDVSEPSDPLEVQADKVADQVMRAPDDPHGNPPPRAAAAARPLLARTVFRACDQCEQEDEESAGSTLQRTPDPDPAPLLTGAIYRACNACASEDESSGDAMQRKGTGGAPFLSRAFEARLTQVRSRGGESLRGGLRGFMERRFGHDFAPVRVHRSHDASELARAAHARAFTMGSDVFFRSGEFRPDTARGKRLIAHELAHVVQQGAHSGPLIRRAIEDDPGFARDEAVPGGRKMKVTGLFEGRESAEYADVVFFDYDSSEVPVSERKRVLEQDVDGTGSWKDKVQQGARITLIGTASEEGNPDYNRRLTDRRLAAVRKALKAPDPNQIQLKNVFGTRGGAGVDFRITRRVEIVPEQGPDVASKAFRLGSSAEARAAADATAAAVLVRVRRAIKELKDVPGSLGGGVCRTPPHSTTPVCQSFIRHFAFAPGDDLASRGQVITRLDAIEARLRAPQWVVHPSESPECPRRALTPEKTTAGSPLSLPMGVCSQFALAPEAERQAAVIREAGRRSGAQHFFFVNEGQYMSLSPNDRVRNADSLRAFVDEVHGAAPASQLVVRLAGVATDEADRYTGDPAYDMRAAVGFARRLVEDAKLALGSLYAHGPGKQPELTAIVQKYFGPVTIGLVGALWRRFQDLSNGFESPELEGHFRLHECEKPQDVARGGVWEKGSPVVVRFCRKFFRMLLTAGGAPDVPPAGFMRASQTSPEFLGGSQVLRWRIHAEPALASQEIETYRLARDLHLLTEERRGRYERGEEDRPAAPVPTAFQGCDPGQQAQITSGLGDAKPPVERAIVALEEALRGTASKRAQETRTLLLHHFCIPADGPLAAHRFEVEAIHNRFLEIQDYLVRARSFRCIATQADCCPPPPAAPNITIACTTGSPGDTIDICPAFFGVTPADQALDLIHEVAHHARASPTTQLDIYAHNSAYPGGREHAVHNADSFRMFAARRLSHTPNC